MKEIHRNRHSTLNYKEVEQVGDGDAEQAAHLNSGFTPARHSYDVLQSNMATLYELSGAVSGVITALLLPIVVAFIGYSWWLVALALPFGFLLGHTIGICLASLWVHFQKPPKPKGE